MVDNITYLKNSPTKSNYADFLKERINNHYTDRLKILGKRGVKANIHGTDPVLLISNDYLSLMHNPQILHAISETATTHGLGLMMSTLFLRDDSFQAEFETKIAKFMSGRDAMLAQSGWSANVGLLEAITDKNQVVYIDQNAHMSIWQGAKSANAQIIPFRHNDVEHLRSKIKKFGSGVIAIDSIYSTSGSIAPIFDFVDASEESGSVLIVDESHSLGVCGDYGEGLVASLGLSDRVDFRTASLSKAFCGRAGVVVCKEKIADYIKCNAMQAIFSSAMLPYEIIGLIETLKIIKQSFGLRKKLILNSEFLRNSLTALGYNVSCSQSHIIPLQSGTEENTVKLRDALEKREVFGSLFVYPATSHNGTLIRFSVNAGLTKEHLEKVVSVCREIRDEVGLRHWASTRKLHNDQAKESSSLDITDTLDLVSSRV